MGVHSLSFGDLVFLDSSTRVSFNGSTLWSELLPTAREGNVLTGVCHSVHNRPHAYTVTVRPRYGAVGTHPTGMLSYTFRKFHTEPSNVRLSNANFRRGSGGGPGARSPPLTLGLRPQNWAFMGPIYFFHNYFLPGFAWHIISLICCFFKVQTQKFSSLTSLSIWFLT